MCKSLKLMIEERAGTEWNNERKKANEGKKRKMQLRKWLEDVEMIKKRTSRAKATLISCSGKC